MLARTLAVAMLTMAVSLPADAGKKLEVSTVGVAIPAPHCPNQGLNQKYLESMQERTQHFTQTYDAAISNLDQTDMLQYRETGSYLTWTQKLMRSANETLVGTAPNCSLMETIQYISDSYTANAKVMDMKSPHPSARLCVWLKGLGPTDAERRRVLDGLPMPQIVNGEGKFGKHFSQSIDCSNPMEPKPR